MNLNLDCKSASLSVGWCFGQGEPSTQARGSSSNPKPPIQTTKTNGLPEQSHFALQQKRVAKGQPEPDPNLFARPFAEAHWKKHNSNSDRLSLKPTGQNKQIFLSKWKLKSRGFRKRDLAKRGTVKQHAVGLAARFPFPLRRLSS